MVPPTSVADVCPISGIQWIYGLIIWQITAGVERCCITGTRKFDRGLGQILHEQLHWLDVPDRVLFKLAVTVHRCLKSERRAPPYLSEHCIPVSSADTRRHLRSANPTVTSTCRTAFAAQHLRPSGVLSCWPDGLELTPGFYPRDPASSTDCFRRLLEPYLFARVTIVHPAH